MELLAAVGVGALAVLVAFLLLFTRVSHFYPSGTWW